MVMKIYNNKLPFAADGYSSDSQVIYAATKGIRPKQPGTSASMCRELWELVSRCWEHDPDSRSQMQEVVGTVRVDPNSCYLDCANIS
jgi:hypothetical protein